MQTCNLVLGKCGVDDPVAPMDAALPDGPPNDVDGDEVLNEADNCRDVFNKDQHDEDGDLRGDVCDNCPHVSNNDQAKNAGDSVGSACDPRPAVAGDTIAAFYPFHVDPAGASANGQWTVTNDAYRFVGSIGFLRLPTMRDRVTIEAAGSLESTTRELYVAVTAGLAVVNQRLRYFTCGYYDCLGAQSCGAPIHVAASVESFDDGTYDVLDDQVFDSELKTDFKIRMTVDPSAARIVCETTDARGTRTTTITNAGNLVPGTIGVESEYDTTYNLRYIAVFGQ